MRKKTILLALVIATALFVGSLPTMLSESTTPDQPEGDCWVVTDDVEDPDIDEHVFYSERIQGAVAESDHDQVWYTEEREPYPISNDGDWIYTTITCTAKISGDNVILTVVTEGTNYSEEEIQWFVINGNQLGANLSVKASWYKWNGGSQPLYCQETEVVGFDDGDYSITLYYAQAVGLEFSYRDNIISPGQKEYWVVTDDNEGQTNQWNVYTPGNPDQGEDLDCAQVWWTDKNGSDEPISVHGWHINTKCLVWAEVSGGDIFVYVKTYGESNYYPEMINWSIEGGDQGTPYFNLFFDAVGQNPATNWNVNVYPGAEPQFKEIGPIDHNWVNLTYYY